MAWTEVGTVSLDGNATTVAVGPVSIPPSGGIEVRVQQLTPSDEAPYRAGLFYVRTTTGRTYGTRKFWGHPEGEDYRLGETMTSEEDTGTLMVEPRYLNLKALKAGRIWQLRFWIRPLATTVQGVSSIAGSFVSSQGGGLELARVVFP